MRLLSNPDSFSKDSSPPLFLGLGNFDGVHLGHQALIRRVTERAREAGGAAALFTFDRHPQSVLHPGSRPALLTSVAHKLSLFDELGVDLCFLLPFTPEFALLEAPAFVENILVGRLGVQEFFLGYNAFFGRDRKGDGRLVSEMAEKFGFRFEEIPPVSAAGDFVSSSRVRRLILAGALEEAAACLGRPYSFFSTVVRGEGRGRLVGFPTANLESAGQVLPPEGVYAVRARLVSVEWKEGEAVKVEEEKVWRPGVMNYGQRPTFSGKGISVAEVHLLNFQGDLYGRTLEVALEKRIRGEMKFSGPDELRRQIESDIAAARTLKLNLPHLASGEGRPK